MMTDYRKTYCARPCSHHFLRNSTQSTLYLALGSECELEISRRDLVPIKFCNISCKQT